MKNYTHLNKNERMEISVLWQAKSSIAEIAKATGRAKSTISRELQRNQAPPGQYWAVLGSIGQYWAVLGSIGQYWAVLGSIGQYWAVLGSIGQYWAVLATIKAQTRNM